MNERNTRLVRRRLTACSRSQTAHKVLDILTIQILECNGIGEPEILTQNGRQTKDRLAQHGRERAGLRAGTHLLRINTMVSFSLPTHYRPTSPPPELEG
jgi:hypothetical protein